MSDFDDLDVSGFEEPPRHPDDISEEQDRLETCLTETMLDASSVFEEYASKYPEKYLSGLMVNSVLLLGRSLSEGAYLRVIRKALQEGLESWDEANDEL